MTHTHDLATLERAARAGGRVLVDAFAALDQLHVRAKGPADFVSEADLGAPPPHFNTIRYHGVLAARAKARSK